LRTLKHQVFSMSMKVLFAGLEAPLLVWRLACKVLEMKHFVV